MNVYDFDKTIYDGDSTVDFFQWCLRRYPKTRRSLWRTGLAAVPFFLGGSKTRFKETFYRFLRYIPDTDAAVAEFWAEHEKNIMTWYREAIRPDDVIISASPEFLLRPICGKLGVRLIASRVDAKTGAYTGENCWGEEKVRRFHEVFSGAEIDDFASDSTSDTPLKLLSRRAWLVVGTERVPWDEYRPGFGKRLRKTFFSRDFLLFVLCGGAGTLVNFCFSLLISSRLDPTLSYVCGYALSLIATYSLNTLLIFRQPFSLVRFLKFVISYIPNFLILFTFVAVFLNICFWPKILVYLSAALLGIPVTFVLVKIFAFANRKRTENNG